MMDVVTSEQVNKLHAEIQELVESLPAHRRMPAGWLAPVVPIGVARAKRQNPGR